MHRAERAAAEAAVAAVAASHAGEAAVAASRGQRRRRRRRVAGSNAGEAAVAALALRLDELSGGDHAGGGRAVERDRAEQRDADDGGESAVAFGVGLVGGRADGRSKRTGEKSASVSAKWRGEQQL